MPLRVNYKDRIGYFTQTQTYGGITKKYKIWLCHSNSLCSMMHFYTKEEEDGKKTPMAQLWAFFADKTHAKRCIQDGMFEGCTNFHFRSKQMDTRLWGLVKVMAQNGIKVTIE